MHSTLALLEKVKNITGWLTEAEADLLLSATLKACIALAPPNVIVEVGSYQGKSTVLFGSVLKAYFPDARVYAIDPHEGVISSSDTQLGGSAPTLDAFNYNIATEGLSGQVELIKDFSFNVVWDKPISLLFIDGLHDYTNVSRDFYHFSEWVRSGGYIAFHDYSSYFPGVVQFVDDILAGNAYAEAGRAGSLIVLLKH